MTKKNSTFDEVIEKMHSDYIPEHIEAAKQYVKMGGNSKRIRSLLDCKKPNQNLISMYFYISGNESYEATAKAWDYLKNRFEENYEELYYDIEFKPQDLKPEHRYLLFASRKYLIIPNRVDCFVDHMADVSKIAEKTRLDYFTSLNKKLKNGMYNEDLESKVFDIRFAVSHISNLEVEGSQLNSMTLSEAEIETITRMTVPFYTVRHLNCSAYYILLYQLWLKYFYLGTIKDQIPDCEILQRFFNENTICKLVGNDDDFKQKILQESGVTTENSSLLHHTNTDSEINKDIDFYLKTYFAQIQTEFDYRFYAVNYFTYQMDFSLDFLENIFLKYLDKEKLFATNDCRTYYALDILIPKGSESAYQWLKDLLADSRMKGLDTYSSNTFVFC